MVTAKILLIDFNSMPCYYDALTSKGASYEYRQNYFSQVMEFLPLYEFHKCVQRYQGDYKARSFSCLDQFLSMAFAQLTYRESLRDIESCLRFMRPKLYHMGFRGSISKSTLADANNQRDWHIYADFAQVLIHRARKLYLHEPFGVELKQAAYALGCYHDRFMFVSVSLGAFSPEQSRGQITYATGFMRQHSDIYPNHRRKSSRYQYPGYPHSRSRILLHHGPRLSGFCSSLHAASREGILHRARQVQYPAAKTLFTPGRQNNRLALRSDNRFDDLPIRQRLSGKTSPDQILRCRAQSTADIFNQSLHARSHQDCSTLQMPLEDRTVFQMDQTTPAYQSIFRHIRKCRQNSNLDRDIHLRADSHYQERAETQAKPLHNSTNFERNHFQQNIYIASTYGN